MNVWDELAIDALIEAGSAKNPFGHPVKYMGEKLGLGSGDARELTEKLIGQKRIRTRSAKPANNFAEVRHIVQMEFVWERIPQDEI